MRALIRFIRRGPAGAIEQKDKLYDGETLTLGRATDQVVQFKDRRVALAHAQIVLRNGQPVLISRVPGGVLVNGIPQREAALRVGDVVTIGANVLRFLEPVDGSDLAFSFELDPDARSDELVAELPRLRLADLGHGKRRWSWLLFAAVLLPSLVIPTAGVRSPGIQDTLRESLLPDDHLWSPGPLSRVHETLGTRCEACHQQPFQRVRNAACLECHQTSLRRHTGPGPLESGPLAAGVVQAVRRPVAALDDARCTNCHSEHHEPAALLREDPAVCVQCHQDLKAVAPWTTSANAVTDFAADHPAFRLPAREAPGLKFPHDLHVRKGGVRSPVGDTVLACADCHRPEPGGARFRPVAMERDCGGCHLLDFDPAYPERTVPHGDAAAVTEFLVDYYSRRYLENYLDPLASPVTVRRVGAPPSAAARERLLRDARSKAEAVARDLFERRSCAECHEVTAADSGTGSREVLPVDIRTAWLPGSAFSHSAHSTALTSCETCHDAPDSGLATDVLMPDIGTCRECHAGGLARATSIGRVTSTCVLCHGFHAEQNPLWSGVAVAQ